MFEGGQDVYKSVEVQGVPDDCVHGARFSDDSVKLPVAIRLSVVAHRPPGSVAIDGPERNRRLCYLPGATAWVDNWHIQTVD